MIFCLIYEQIFKKLSSKNAGIYFTDLIGQGGLTGGKLEK